MTSAPIEAGRLAGNLAAMQGQHAALAGRLRAAWAAGGPSTVVAGDRLAVGRRALPLAWGPIVAGPPGDGQTTLRAFGVGLGEGVDRALRLGRTVHAWDRDPWLWREALSRHDWSAALASGALIPALGADLLQWRGGGDVWIHPVLGGVYAMERAFVASDPSVPPVLVVEGELFYQDLCTSLRHLGRAPLPWAVDRLPLPEADHTLRAVASPEVWAINLRPGMADACAAAGRRLIVWEIDPKLGGIAAVGPEGASCAAVFTWRAAEVAELRAAGYRDVAFLPLASDPRRRRPLSMPAGTASPGVVFVGASMVDGAQALRPRFVARLAAFWGGDAARAEAATARWLSRQAMTPMRWAIPGWMDAEAPGFRAAGGRDDPALWLGEVAAAERRLNLVAGLADLGVTAYGDAGWRLCVARGIRYGGPLAHGDPLTAVYGNAVVNVDIGRLYQLDIVTMRVFDVMACGGLVLAEHSDGLADLFDVGRELDAWRSPEELHDKAAWYLARPQVAREIGARARQAAVDRHDVRLRVASMLARAAEATSTRPAADGSA